MTVGAVGFLFGISASGFGLGMFTAHMIAMVDLAGSWEGAIAMARRVMTIELVELPSPAVSAEPSHSVPFYMSCVVFTAHQVFFTRCSGLGARPIDHFG